VWLYADGGIHGACTQLDAVAEQPGKQAFLNISSAWCICALDVDVLNNDVRGDFSDVHMAQPGIDLFPGLGVVHPGALGVLLPSGGLFEPLPHPAQGAGAVRLPVHVQHFAQCRSLVRAQVDGLAAHWVEAVGDVLPIAPGACLHAWQQSHGGGPVFGSAHLHAAVAAFPIDPGYQGPPIWTTVYLQPEGKQVADFGRVLHQAAADAVDLGV